MLIESKTLSFWVKKWGRDLKVNSKSVTTRISVGRSVLPCSPCFWGGKVSNQRLRLPGKQVEGALWAFLYFLPHPWPLSSLLCFLCRWPPHRSGGHPGSRHRKPHHLRRDCPALRRLCLCSQQAWHPGEKDSAGPAGGARYTLHPSPSSYPRPHAQLSTPFSVPNPAPRHSPGPRPESLSPGSVVLFL
jgi:hypothetical protein